MDYLEIKGLFKSYNNDIVLNNININIKKGEFVTLLGPSGCGKSTLLRCISGLTDVDKGEIYVDGKLINNLNPNKRNISMVFQSYALFPNMTVMSNIEFGLKMKKLPLKEIKKKVETVINLVDLNGYENRYPSELSGGQQQRVALARALVIEPKLLLLDEPLSALDAKIRKSLRTQINEIQRRLQITTIFVTHDQEEALTMSDRVLLINNGKVVQEGTPEDIYKNPSDEFSAGFIGNYNIIEIEKLKSITNNAELGIKGNLIAIRPEAILIKELEDIKNDVKGINLSVKIIDKVLLGSLLRYVVKLNDVTLKIDTLNRSNINMLDKNNYIEIIIPESELKILA